MDVSRPVRMTFILTLLDRYAIFGPSNESPMATNVVVDLLLLSDFQLSK